MLKIFPGGNEAVIAKKEVNLERSFGEQFEEQTIEMEVTKQAGGSNIKSLKYHAKIICSDEKHRTLYN